MMNSWNQVVPLRYAPALLVALVFLMLWFGWVGYIASDDSFYAQGAQGWLASFPYIGDTHWSLRHPFVVPVALSFGIFGINEYSLVLVTTLYYLVLVYLAYRITGKSFDAGTALAVGSLLAVLPLLVVWGTIANEDIPGAFFVLLSVWWFFSAVDRPRPPLTLFLAGLAAGLAWWCKETAAGLLLLYGICFLIGYRYPRKAYWIVAAGFATLWLSEWAFYWVQMGDPLYRIHIDIDQGASKLPTELIRAQPGTGNLEFGRWINPVLAILSNPAFGLLYYLFVPAALWGWRTTSLAPSQAALLRLMIGLTLAWFVTIGYVIPLRSLPRYFTVSSVTATMVVAIWLAHGLPRLRAIQLALLHVLLALMLVYLANREPLWGARQLVKLVRQETATIFYTDPSTADDASFLLASQGLAGRVRPGLPAVGGLYFYNPNSIGRHPQEKDFAKRYAPTADMVAVQEIAPQRKVTAVLAELVGLRNILPAGIWRKIDRQNENVALYRIAR